MNLAGFLWVYAGAGPGFRARKRPPPCHDARPIMGDSPEAIPARLARGERADVVILDGGSADDLGRRGLVRADSKVGLASSLIAWWCAPRREAGHRQRRGPSGARCLRRSRSRTRIQRQAAYLSTCCSEARLADRVRAEYASDFARKQRAPEGLDAADVRLSGAGAHHHGRSASWRSPTLPVGPHQSSPAEVVGGPSIKDHDICALASSQRAGIASGESPSMGRAS